MESSLNDIENGIEEVAKKNVIQYEELPRQGPNYDSNNNEPHLGSWRRQRKVISKQFIFPRNNLVFVKLILEAKVTIYICYHNFFFQNWNSAADEINVPVSRPERKRRRRKRPLSLDFAYDYTIVNQYTKPRRNKMPYLRRAKGSSRRWN